MTLATHAAVGAAAAAFFPEHPYLAFAAGFASHFAIDSLPHCDYASLLRSSRKNPFNPLETDMVIGRAFLHDLKLLGFDALIGFALAFFVAWFFGMDPRIALVGAGAGIFPDLLQFVYFKTRRTFFERVLNPLQRFHVWIQEGREHPEWGWKTGAAIQAMGVIILLIVVRYFV